MEIRARYRTTSSNVQSYPGAPIARVPVAKSIIVTGTIWGGTFWKSRGLPLRVPSTGTGTVLKLRDQKKNQIVTYVSAARAVHK